MVDLTPPVFVFGSNLGGRHGKGAARWAMKYRGAIYGQGIGYQGNSYAIPTKSAIFNSLKLERIQEFVDQFKMFAHHHPELTFELTPIGCGLAGFTPAQIGPMFKGCPSNVRIPDEFIAYTRPVAGAKSTLVILDDPDEPDSSEASEAVKDLYE